MTKSKLKDIASTTLLLWCSATFADTPAVEFKGLRPGNNTPQLLSDPAWKCRSVRALGADTECSNRTETIAGVKPIVMLAHLKQERLLAISILIRQRDFAQATDAFRSKYGMPEKARTVEKRTRAGAVFNSAELTWSDEMATVRLLEHSNNIDTSSIVFASKDGHIEMQKQRSEQAESNKNDM